MPQKLKQSSLIQVSIAVRYGLLNAAPHEVCLKGVASRMSGIDTMSAWNPTVDFKSLGKKA